MLNNNKNGNLNECENFKKQYNIEWMKITILKLV